MRIITGHLQVARTAPINEQALVATAEHMPKELMPVIQSQGVAAEQPAHALDQITLGRFHHQVKVIAHQTIGMNLKASFPTPLRHGLQEIESIHVVEVDGFLPIAPAHHVVDRPRILDARLSRHAHILEQA